MPLIRPFKLRANQSIYEALMVHAHTYPYNHPNAKAYKCAATRICAINIDLIDNFRNDTYYEVLNEFFSPMTRKFIDDFCSH